MAFHLELDAFKLFSFINWSSWFVEWMRRTRNVVVVVVIVVVVVVLCRHRHRHRHRHMPHVASVLAKLSVSVNTVSYASALPILAARNEKSRKYWKYWIYEFCSSQKQNPNLSQIDLKNGFNFLFVCLCCVS